MKKLFLLFCLMPLTVLAAEKADITALKQRLNQVLPPNMHIDAIHRIKQDNLYEIIAGSDVFYITSDGRYLLNGDLIDLKSQQNLTDNRRNGLRKKLINSVSEKDMIIFGPKNAKHTMTVFTDIDCGYCRKLHSQIDQYIQMGFRVRYLSFPRAGIGSSSYNKAVSVWCAKDRKKALTLAKRGGATPAGSCDNPVTMEYNLGLRLGVRGTPTIILDDGRLIPGYVPPGKLLSIANQSS